MAHCTKFVRAATGGMFIHFDRTTGHELSNQDIDSTRTELNYNLASNDQPLHQSTFLRNRLSEVETNGRKNQNVMCDWIVTLPKNIKDNEEQHFFKETYDFLSSKYGRENVISAYVHKDETTPHMHFAFVPVEKETNKLNAKAIINRNELRSFHAELSQYLNEKIGYECGILNGITHENGGNKSIIELKNNNLLDLEQINEDVKSIHAIRDVLHQIPLPIPENVTKRSLMGSKQLKTLNLDEWETTQNTIFALKKENSALKESALPLQQALKYQKDIIHEITKEPLIKQNQELKQELIEVKTDLNFYQQFIEKFNIQNLFLKFKKLFRSKEEKEILELHDLTKNFVITKIGKQKTLDSSFGIQDRIKQAKGRER